MRVRCDGQQTRARVVDAACNVFGERGFREATHEAISREAGTNKAAINHHFGDKRSLYRAVWTHLLDNADREGPVSGNLPAAAPAAERLEAHVRALLSRHAGKGASWQLARLRDLEQVAPTGLIDDIRSAHHDGNRRQMLGVLAELLGDGASRFTIEFYETAARALSSGGWGASSLPGSDGPERRPLGARKLSSLARQIARFLLAGIEAAVHKR
jgi:AcrR family transcriptional regulator